MAIPNDNGYMAVALALARRGLGQVWPNPAVGCVLVRHKGGSDRIVGRGWTMPGGRPHAETGALSQAGNKARGATAYVTLEPCAHHGETQPCAEALVTAGVARVVSALEDPDPRVNGAGHALLRDAGVALTTGVLAEEARELNVGFLSRLTRARPHVTLKLAMSADGKIAAGPGAQTEITSERSRDKAHMMRALTDAIMVGSGTWRADDPRLTCRLPGLHQRSPVRIALDACAELPIDSRLVSSSRDTPLWLVTAPNTPSERCALLASAGVDVLDCPIAADGRFDLSALLELIAGRGITRLMVEGGAALCQSFLSADFIDEVQLFIAPRQLGPRGVSVPPELLPEVIDREHRFVLVSTDRLGPDRLNTYRRK